ncbi:hypothetical protein BJ741DRAFT_699524 [Chytriomyces cf. hyalinus JEL632]|nr:hypothetical protein BJ741DRAFT_699524 [Chytriomyces cf. hyalinus JEL632]
MLGKGKMIATGTASSANSTGTTIETLPTEILQMIFQHVRHKRSNLEALSAVSVRFALMVRPFLNREIKFRSTLSWAEFIMLLVGENEKKMKGDHLRRCQFGRYVQVVDLSASSYCDNRSRASSPSEPNAIRAVILDSDPYDSQNLSSIVLVFVHSFRHASSLLRDTITINGIQKRVALEHTSPDETCLAWTPVTHGNPHLVGSGVTQTALCRRLMDVELIERFYGVSKSSESLENNVGREANAQASQRRNEDRRPMSKRSGQGRRSFQSTGNTSLPNSSTENPVIDSWSFHNYFPTPYTFEAAAGVPPRTDHILYPPPTIPVQLEPALAMPFQFDPAFLMPIDAFPFPNDANQFWNSLPISLDLVDPPAFPGRMGMPPNLLTNNDLFGMSGEDLFANFFSNNDAGSAQNGFYNSVENSVLPGISSGMAMGSSTSSDFSRTSSGRRSNIGIGNGNGDDSGGGNRSGSGSGSGIGRGSGSSGSGSGSGTGSGSGSNGSLQLRKIDSSNPSKIIERLRFQRDEQLSEILTANEDLQVLESRNPNFATEFKRPERLQQQQNPVVINMGEDDAMQAFEARETDKTHTLHVPHNPVKIVSASSLIHLAQKCPNLKSLNLAHCTVEPDTYFPETKQYLSMLFYVPDDELTRVIIHPADAILELIRSCARLVNLDLSGCKWVTLDVIHAIANVDQFALKALNLCGCFSLPPRLHTLFVTKEPSELKELLTLALLN